MSKSQSASSRLQKALIDPASVFASPMEVVDDETLPADVKIKILRRWEYDALEMQVAVEEGFPPGSEESLLDTVLASLHRLGAGPDLEHSPPTKQGGV